MTTPRTILCFGDSNTHGTLAMRTPADRRRLPRPARWPSVMAQHLGAGWEVIAEGHPGRTAVFDDPVEGRHKNGLRVLPALLETHRPIDLVIVMLGTNDLKARFNASATDIALGLGRLAGEIRKSDCGPDGRAPEVLLVAPVPISETGVFAEIFKGGAEKSRALPAILRTVAQRVGVGFADLSGVASTDLTDGIHLDQAAHMAIGVALAAVVTETCA